MTWEDYKNETRENIKEYIRENYDKEDLECVTNNFVEKLRYDLLMSDSVTGNASGSYTCNSYEAEQNVQGILWDNDFINTLKFLYDQDIGECIKNGPEYLDVTARCVAVDNIIDLRDVIDEVYEEMEEE